MAENTTGRPLSRGFITVATGREKYYWLAWHLLQSYRFHAAEPLPFAILCDRENRYTRDFDRVILMENAGASYNDKLRLPDYVPFDETIFVDADTLAYTDLNRYWEDFENAPDFSAYGETLPLDAETCWFHPEDTGRYRDRLHFCNWFQGGVYFLRRTETLKELSALCREIYDTYDQYRFWRFEEPCDEPIFALAMSVLDLPTVPEPANYNCFFPGVRTIRCDIRTGLLEFTSIWKPEDTPVIRGGTRIHWATRYTSKYLYQREAFRLRCCVHKDHLMTVMFMLRHLPRQIAERLKRLFRRG